MINGAPTDPNAASFKKGAHSVLDSSGFKIVAEYDTPDWSPDKAQAWMERPARARQEQSSGVYAANDGTGRRRDRRAEGRRRRRAPARHGQDAELAAIQRILAGDQAMTIYKPIKPRGRDRRRGGRRAGQRRRRPSRHDDDDYKGVPSTILDPIVVTKDNVKDTVVKDKFYKVDDICTGTSRACTGRHQLTTARRRGTASARCPPAGHAAHRWRRRPVTAARAPSLRLHRTDRRTDMTATLGAGDDSRADPARISKRFGAVQALTTSTSTSTPARSSPSSATTARASRRSSR